MFFGLFAALTLTQRDKRRAYRVCAEVRNLLAELREHALTHQGEFPSLLVPTVDKLDAVPLEGNADLTTVHLSCINQDAPWQAYWLHVRLQDTKILSISITEKVAVYQDAALMSAPLKT